MPSLGADMDAATLVEWHVVPGDAVRRGQVVAVVETQKGAIDVEAWEEGVVERLVAGAGDKVPVGGLLAVLRAPGESAGSAAAVAQAVPVPQRPEADREQLERPIPAPARPRVAPAARKLAAELGVDVDALQPAEAGGVVSREDVERAAHGQKGRPLSSGKDWHAQMREAIAAAMSRSKREIPHYYLASDIDVTAVAEWLACENLKRSVADRMLMIVPLMKAAALALRAAPALNGTWKGQAFRPSQAVHVGIAITMRGGGLVAPAIHDADRKSLGELMSDLRDLVARVRGGRLRSSELSDPTITLTSLGEQGVESVFGVIYPPQVAIVGLGRMGDRPCIRDGVVTVRKMLTATLAADHRVSDGHQGALFLLALERILRQPEKLA